MTRLLCVYLLVVFTTGCAPVEETETEKGQRPASEVQTETTFDAELAKKLGADEYGMGRYVLAFLKAGPNRDQDSTTAANLQKAHLKNIGRLAEEGKLALAGPFLDDGEMRGIYIFNVSTIEEAAALTATDPAIKAGRLVMELHPWYGSAALKMVNEWHGKLEAKNVAGD